MRINDGIINVGKIKRVSLKGVYQIGNDINEYVYIGSSKDLFHRMSTHLSLLKHGCNKNPNLQAFYNENGIKHIVIKVLEYCSESKLKEREQYYMDNAKYLYNVVQKSDENYKIPLDKCKMAKRRIMQFDLDSNYIATYDSLTEASEKTGTRINGISSVASMNRYDKTSNGYIWRYESKR